MQTHTAPGSFLKTAAVLFAATFGCAGQGPEREMACTVAAVTHLPDQLHESSGVAASQRHEGLVWTHNDSGGEAVLYGVGLDGRISAEIELRNAQNVDWEDLAVAPCPDGQAACIYVADIGDNRAERDDIGVYVLPEPAELGQTQAEADFLSVRYPDGPRDAEGLLVADDGRLLIVSKGREHPIAVFMSQPVTPGSRETLALRQVQTLSDGPIDLPQQVTGATRRDDLVILRSYNSLQAYRLAGQRLRPQGRPVNLQPLGEPQGEGVTILPDGTIVLSSEEGPQSVAARLTRLRCDLAGLS